MNDPCDATDAQLRRVAEDGADMSSDMVIDFSVSAADERSARSIAALAAQRGYDPSIADNGAGKPWSVYCSKSMLATQDGVMGCQQELNTLAVDHGGHCDGWSTFGNGA